MAADTTVYRGSTAEGASPTPRRRMQWIRALRALRRLSRGEYDGDAIQEYAMALDGGDGERDFQAFLAEPGAADLLAGRPDLAATLDDAGKLREMPEGSLGRAYLALAERDRIRIAALVEGFRRARDYPALFPDEARRWFADRGTASHDLDHVLTGYDRTEPGELLLIAFTVARRPRRVLRVSLVISLITVPPRAWIPIAGDLWRAWRRGRAARIGRAIAWEDLLPLPIEDVRRRLGMVSLEDAHPKGVWRVGADGSWERASAAA